MADLVITCFYLSPGMLLLTLFNCFPEWSWQPKRDYFILRTNWWTVPGWYWFLSL